MSPIKYEMFADPKGFYIQWHCECGSTMSSGEHLSTPDSALAACQDSMIEHQRMHIRQQVARSTEALS